MAEGFTGRAIRNAFTDRWHGIEASCSSRNPTSSGAYSAAAQTGDLETALVSAGEELDLVRDVRPAAAIIAEIMREADAVRGRLCAPR